MKLRVKSAPLLRACVAAAFLVALAPAAVAQSSARPQKLPKPEKIVEAYLKAVGGKKRVAAIRDASYVWDVSGADGAQLGTARTHTKAPSASRSVRTSAGSPLRSTPTRCGSRICAPSRAR